MSDHLPECPCFLSVRENVCLCDPLRACEARVRSSEFPLGVAVGKHDGFLEGYAAALDAARDAVAALPWKVAVSFGPIDCDESCEHGPCTCSGVMRPEAWMTGPADVRAAIDALRGESDG